MGHILRTIVCRDPTKLPSAVGRTVATLGSFDGVHLGHQQLIRRLVELRGTTEFKDGRSVVLTFYPHPGVVLGKTSQIPLLTTLRQKREILEQFEIDVLYKMHFTKSVASLSMNEFIVKVLIKILNVDYLVIGQDARIGRGAEGTAEKIISAFASLGRSGEIVPIVDQDALKIGSRRIREAILDGDVKTAGRLLGRPFALDSRVVHGDGRGRGIGFPTANLISPGQINPALGVYACQVIFEGKKYGAVTNVGVRPTFNGKSARVESHILDFTTDSLYGRRLSLEFIERIRAERKFESIDSLKNQISLDVAQARKILSIRK